MKTAELKNMAPGELQEKLDEFRKELFNLRFQHATAQLENTQRIPEVKKNIARILTILREHELAKEVEAGE
jgi:large subunit ribosomal protein L29